MTDSAPMASPEPTPLPRTSRVAHIVGSCRSPFAPRHGVLAHHHPVDLLAATLRGLAVDTSLPLEHVDQLLVVCDTPVGAQSLNVARQALIVAGWPRSIAAVSLDGQGVGAFVGLRLAAGLDGVTVVAGVDCTSLVPPGAGTVRDYGMPHPPSVLAAAELDGVAPAGVAADKVAGAHDIGQSQAEALAAEIANWPPYAHEGIVAVSGPARAGADATIRTDRHRAIEEQPADGGAAVPMFTDDGATSAISWAGLADGAAAVMVSTLPEHTGDAAVGPVVVSDGDPTDILAPLCGALHGCDPDLPVVLSEPFAAIHLALPGAAGRACHDAARVLATGSAPSADVLRAVVDAAHGVREPVIVAARGALGTAGAVEIRPLGPS